MLSVDFIEYRPNEPRTKLNDRPIVRPTRHVEVPITVSSASVVDPAITRLEQADPASPDTIALDVRIPAPETLRPPTRPYALRRR